MKNFWQICVLLLSLIGFQLRDDTTLVMIMINESVYSCWTLAGLVIVVCIPVYQLIIWPFFSKCIPRMLTRMKIGLVVVLLSLLSTTVISHQAFNSLAYYKNKTTYAEPSCAGAIIQNTSTTPASICSVFHSHRWCEEIANASVLHEHSSYSPSQPVMSWLILIPQALNGIAHMLVFLTVLEFIFAQAPHRMQGLLIGLWYAMQSINVGIGVIGNVACVAFYWEYYLAKTVLVFLSIVLFFYASRKYKCRKLNEDIDINIQQEIEQAFERNFDREAEFEQKQFQHDNIYLVESMN